MPRWATPHPTILRQFGNGTPEGCPREEITTAATSGTIPLALGDEITTTAAIETGITFTFIPNPNITATIKTTITVYGNETGGSQTIPVTITYVQPK